MSLPPLFDAWTQAILGDSPPDETQATCDDCAMCDRPGKPSSNLPFYDPRTKCCTYSPLLDNFLVGHILREDDPQMAEGVRRVRARLAAGAAVTPLGIGPAPAQRLLYREGATDVFGKTLALRCPYYLEELGACGVWRHRNAICSTAFCKHNRGAVGRRFWSSMTSLLGWMSEALAMHCALELGLDDEALRFLLPPPGTKRSSLDPSELDGGRAADYDARWGAWKGREEAYFGACAEIVAALSPAEVLAVAGARARVAAAAAKQGYEALVSTRLPTALRAGSFSVRVGPENVYLNGYSGSDELEAPRILLDILPYFDGRPLDATLEHIEEELGVKLERDLILKLLDFEVLVPADAPATPSVVPLRSTRKRP
jgi:hypothetical protein